MFGIFKRKRKKCKHHFSIYELMDTSKEPKCEFCKEPLNELIKDFKL